MLYLELGDAAPQQARRQEVTVAAQRTLVRVVLVPAPMFALPVVQVALWVLGWTLGLVAIGSWLMASEVG